MKFIHYTYLIAFSFTLILESALYSQVKSKTLKSKDDKSRVEMGTKIEKIEDEKENFIVNISKAKNLKAENLFDINSNSNDEAVQISPNGNYLLFQSDRSGYFEGNNIWICINGPSGFSSPQLFSIPILADEIRTVGNTFKEMQGIQRNSDRVKFNPNSSAFEGSPHLIYEQNKPVELFYTFSITESSDPTIKEQLKIYSAREDKQKGLWTVPSHIKELYSYFEEGSVTLDASGKTMVFSSNRKDGYGGGDLWISKRKNLTSEWEAPKNIGAIVNTLYNETTPSLSPSGEILFFSSDRPGGLGGYDLYMTSYTNSGWGNPINLGEPFNSSFDDLSLSLTENYTWAYFVSDRTIDKKLNPAKELRDIYRVKLPPSQFNSKELALSINILDANSKDPLLIPANIITTNGGQKREGSSRIVWKQEKEEKRPKENKYKIALTKAQEYKVIVSAQGYNPQEFIFNTGKYILPNTTRGLVVLLQKRATEEELKFSSEDCKSGLPYCLKKIHIYFDQGSMNYKKEENEKVETIVKILKRHSYLKLLIEGHTDTTNTSEYNLKLSLERAKTIYTSLVRAGIAENRLNVYGYGFTRKAVQEKTKIDQALNRRVEFVILQD